MDRCSKYQAQSLKWMHHSRDIVVVIGNSTSDRALPGECGADCRRYQLQADGCIRISTGHPRTYHHHARLVYLQAVSHVSPTLSTLLFSSGHSRNNKEIVQRKSLQQPHLLI
jgi:hypothetical protein